MNRETTCSQNIKIEDNKQEKIVIQIIKIQKAFIIDLYDEMFNTEIQNSNDE